MLEERDPDEIPADLDPEGMVEKVIFHCNLCEKGRGGEHRRYGRKVDIRSWFGARENGRELERAREEREEEGSNEREKRERKRDRMSERRERGREIERGGGV
eukprot:764831-Amorphochlora_amoeboformis.AAC.1